VGDDAKLVICNGDMLQVTINPPCVVPQLAAPVPLVASGFSTVNDQAVCVEGDELPPSIKNVPLPYTSAAYVGGTGTLKVTLNADNKTSTATDKDKKMLLKGSTFQAEFDVQSPAQMPTPGGPQPDPQPKYTGTAKFITTNTVASSE
jgi:hypothetical protein